MYAGQIHDADDDDDDDEILMSCPVRSLAER